VTKFSGKPGRRRQNFHTVTAPLIPVESLRFAKLSEESVNMPEEMMFTNGEGLKEYAESLSPEERDTTIVMTTVTAIRSFEIDLAIVLARETRLRELAQNTIDCIEAEGMYATAEEYQAELEGIK
jgi:hypothetical protein